MAVEVRPFDSLGRFEIDWLKAGTGIVHAEYNLDDEPLELFQIWIQPRTRSLAPRWAQRAFPSGERAGALVTLASGHDAEILLADLP